MALSMYYGCTILFIIYLYLYYFCFLYNLSSLDFVFILHLTIYFCSLHIYRSGFPGPYNGHGTWNPRARHMYEELNGSNPRCRGHLPPCPGSDETMYTRCRGKKDDKRTNNYCTAALLFNISGVRILLINQFRTV